MKQKNRNENAKCGFVSVYFYGYHALRVLKVSIKTLLTLSLFPSRPTEKLYLIDDFELNDITLVCIKKEHSNSITFNDPKTEIASLLMVLICVVFVAINLS